MGERESLTVIDHVLAAPGVEARLESTDTVDGLEQCTRQCSYGGQPACRFLRPTGAPPLVMGLLPIYRSTEGVAAHRRERHSFGLPRGQLDKQINHGFRRAALLRMLDSSLDMPYWLKYVSP